MGDEHKVRVIEMVEKQENGALGAVQYLVVVAIYSILGLAIDYWLFVAAGAATAWANPLTYIVMVFLASCTSLEIFGHRILACHYSRCYFRPCCDL